MADNYLNNTGLAYYHNRIKTIFADKTEFDTLSDTVDELVETGGEPNVIETVKVNGTALTPDAQKAVDVEAAQLTFSDTSVYTQLNITQGDISATINKDKATDYVDVSIGQDEQLTDFSLATIEYVGDAVPTKVSDLTNDSGFQTATEVGTAIDTALANGNDPYTTTSDAQGLIDDALADITGIDFQIVATLPASGEKGVIYLVGTDSPYDEYIWIEPTGGTAHFEQIGSTDIDLSDYWAKTELVAITTAQIDTLFA